MSKYTATIKEIIESTKLATYTGSDEPAVVLQELTKSEIFQIGRTLFPQIFDFYSDDTDEKTKFENEFIQHFYFYEIGQETVGQFKWYLEDFLNMRMPYYKQLYETQLDGLANALINFDYENKLVSSGTNNKTGTKSRADTETNEIGENITDTKALTNSKTIDRDTSSSRTAGVAIETGNTTKKLQFPINDSIIQEIGRDTNDGTDNRSITDSNMDTEDVSESEALNDTSTRARMSNQSRGINSSENTNESGSKQEISTRTIRGMYEMNKIKATKEYRELIFSINELIFKDALQYDLFMKLW